MKMGDGLNLSFSFVYVQNIINRLNKHPDYLGCFFSSIKYKRI